MSTTLEPRVKTLKDGSKVWYRGDKIHRDGGPAVEMADGTRYWYRDGFIHRDAGPAVEYSPNGVVELWVNGVFQRREQSHGETQPRAQEDTPEPSVVPLAGKIAHLFDAMTRCEERGSREWAARHYSRILLEMEKAFGDAPVSLDMARSTGEKLVFQIATDSPPFQAHYSHKLRTVSVQASMRPEGVRFVHAGRESGRHPAIAQVEKFAALVEKEMTRKVSCYDERPVLQESERTESVLERLSKVMTVLKNPRVASESVIREVEEAARKADFENQIGEADLEGYAEDIVKRYMPSGSGFDSGTKIDIDRSTAEKLVFTTSFHHMNDGGFYDGWTEHTVTVRPSLVLGETLTISGRDRSDVKEFIHQVFQSALSAAHAPLGEGIGEATAEKDRLNQEEEDDQEQGLSR